MKILFRSALILFPAGESAFSPALSRYVRTENPEATIEAPTNRRIQQKHRMKWERVLDPQSRRIS